MDDLEENKSLAQNPTSGLEVMPRYYAIKIQFEEKELVIEVVRQRRYSS